MPARRRNNSPVMWPAVPTPSEAHEMLPGLALASAISSFTSLAGSEGCATSALVMRPICVTGVMSLKVS